MFNNSNIHGLTAATCLIVDVHEVRSHVAGTSDKDRH